uniref:ion transporter n=1 Tax=Mycolicibacterium poriferae TaxID=39694 RepID=UPI0024BB0738
MKDCPCGNPAQSGASYGHLASLPGMRQGGGRIPLPETALDRLRQIVTSPRTERFILALIILNAITLGLETSAWVMDRIGPMLLVLDKVVLAIFVIEVVARIAVHRLAFFKDPWSLFDFAVVAIALVPAAGPFSVLRALRILRVLRMITIVPSLKRGVGALISALPGMG